MIIFPAKYNNKKSCDMSQLFYFWILFSCNKMLDKYLDADADKDCAAEDLRCLLRLAAEITAENGSEK